MVETTKPEWFRWMFGMAQFNINLARRLIASGEVIAQIQTVDVRDCHALLGLDQNDYGSGDFSDDIESGRGINPMSAIQHRSNMANIPDDKMNEPAIIAMIDSADIMQRIGLKLDNNAREEKQSPFLIDGNHRLGRKFLEGEATAQIYVVPHEEALKFAFDRYQYPLLKRTN